MQRSARTKLSILAIIVSLIFARDASAAPRPALELGVLTANATIAFESSGILPVDLPPVVRLIVDRLTATT